MDRLAVETPDTDEWWVKHLYEKLARQAKSAALCRDWYENNPPLPSPDNEKPNWERLQRIAQVNLASLIVNARLFRVNLKGARTALDESANGDDVLNRSFVEQDAEKKLQDAFRYALAEGRGFITLSTEGEMRASDAMHTAVEHDAAGKVIAALSVHRDVPGNRDVMVLARPGYFRTAYKEGATLLPGRLISFMSSPESWELGAPSPSGLDFVPAYELVPLNGSVIERHMRTLERINHGILQRLVTIALQAFRQRALKDMPLTDPETGEESDDTGVFESAPDAVWMLPEGVEVWESGQADLTPMLASVKDDIKTLAVESKTPIYLITPDDANGSAKGAETQQEGVVFSVRSIHTAFNGPLRRMLSDMLTIRGETERADLAGVRLLWEKPTKGSIAERAAAAETAARAGIPFRTRMEVFAELAPEEIDSAERQRADDIFALAAAGADTAAAA